jgi:indole-3-glycerol phosphate synthase
VHKTLTAIIEAKKKRIVVLKKNYEAIIALAKKAPAPRDFKEALRRKGKFSLVAEVKQASPSEGLLCRDFDPVALARFYQDGKVGAISVITEEDFFMGKLNYLQMIRKEVVLPLLRKDFILDELQVYESRAAGADAILLVGSMLASEQLKRLYELTRKLGMEAVVEVHNEKDLHKVLGLGVEVIAINNRDTQTFKVDFEVTRRLIHFIPGHVVKVSKGGITSLKDILLLKGLGADAALVGTALIRSQDVTAKLRELNIDSELSLA